MEKEFIPYEQALALKELGFDSDVFKSYDTSVVNLDGKFLLDYYYNVKSINEVKAPTFSQAFRWFREKYHIIGEVKFKGGKTTKTAWYDYVIYSEIDWNDENPNEQWKKHEEAELECLKKLIEIVKEKK